MGLVNAVYNWGTVKALHCTVFSMNLAGLVALALAIIWSIRFERGFGDYLNLVTPGDGHVWATVIISAAVLCSPAYFLGIKSWLYMRPEPGRCDLEDPLRVDGTVDPHYANRLLFLHVVACLLSGFLVAILNATYLALLSGFQQKSRDGLIEAIEKYSSDVAVKARVDAVQTELECCGDNSYQDWFRVPWLKLSMEGPEDAEQGPRLEGQPEPEDREEESSTPMDVPFSCCSNDIPKPCVHHDILKPSAVYDYNPKHLTIATLGCRSRIISRGETIRTFLAGYLALLSVYQVVLSYFSRLLQTAHSNELYIGPQKPRYYAWIFSKPDSFPATAPRRSKRSHPLSQRSNQSPASSASEAPDEREGVDTPTKRHRRKTRSLKVLHKIRSKISSVKSKSFPLLKPSMLFKKPRSRQRNTYRTQGEEAEEPEDQDEEEEERLSDSRRLLPTPTESDLDLKEDPSSDPSSPDDANDDDDSSTADLPPPPPPPPFVASLDIVNEDRGPIDVPSKQSNTEIDINTAFGERIMANQNSGRRIMVLERFGRIWERAERGIQRRKRGGADYSSSEHSFRSTRSERRSQVELVSTDVYDRFRGSLQHTLARRESIQVGRGLKNACPESWPNVDVRKSNLLARLRCNNVPPSYRLLANCEVQRRPAPQTHPSPPPLPPPLPPGNTTPLPRRQCSICNRPVQRGPVSLSQSLVGQESGGALASTRPRRLPAVLSRGRGRFGRDYLPRSRSNLPSMPVERR